MRQLKPLATFLCLILPGDVIADVEQAMKRASSGVFAASDDIRCAQNPGQALGSCTAQVARHGASSVVMVKFPNGFSRLLSFSDGAFLRGNATMSGVGTDTDWRLQDEMFDIRVDDQRYEIPKALVFSR